MRTEKEIDKKIEELTDLFFGEEINDNAPSLRKFRDIIQLLKWVKGSNKFPNMDHGKKKYNPTGRIPQ